jgi:hypothetical protein
LGKGEGKGEVTIYALVRGELVKRKTFFQHLQVLTCYWYFENWDVMMVFMIEGLELEVPQVPDSG